MNHESWHSGTNTALIIAHPGHELRLAHWLERMRPIVHILTDGSGRSEQARIDSSLTILKSTGAIPGAIMGRNTDRGLYADVLNQRTATFEQLTHDLTVQLVRSEVQMVVGDAEEGRVMAHDLYRAVRFAAIESAALQLGRPIVHYEFVLDSSPNACPDELRSEQVRFALDSNALKRKLALARNYRGLQKDVDEAIHRYGEQAFATEYLFPAVENNCDSRLRQARPEYEEHGRRLVESGVYETAVTFADHIVPLMRKLQAIRWVES